MTLDIALRAFVLDDGTIYTLITERMYPIRLPQKVTLPAVTYQQISDVRVPHLRGVAGLSRTRYQLDAYALLPKDAKALGGLIRQRLDGFSGMWPENGGSPLGSPDDRVVIQGTFFDGAMDLFDEDILGGTSRHSADYFIVHSTAAGTL